jgi:hypothetical protein
LVRKVIKNAIQRFITAKKARLSYEYANLQLNWAEKELCDDDKKAYALLKQMVS